MKNTIYLALSILLVTSCSKKTPTLDPYSFAPKDIRSIWIPMKNDIKICSKFCSPILPSSYKIGDLSLAKLIDIALINNPSTKQTWATARSAAASYAQANSDYYPSLDMDASYTRERENHLNTEYKLNNRKKFIKHYLTEVNPEITLSYIIYDFGRRSSYSRAAKYALHYADWMHNDEIQSVMQDTINYYYTYQYQKKAYDAKKKDLEDAATSLDAANKKFVSGIVAIGDVSQAKTKYLQAKMDLIDKKNDLDNSYFELINKIGIPSNEKLEIEDLPDNAFLNVVIDNLDALIKKAEEFRQDFLAAQANVKYYKEQLNYAKSELFPTIKTDLEIGRNYYDKGLHEDYHFSAAFKFSVPIFKGFYYRNGIKKAKADLLKAKASLEQVELGVIKDVVETRNEVVLAKEILKCSTEYLKAAKEEFKIALANYKAGTNTIVELMSAQASLADAREKDAKSKTDWFTAITNLAYATGSLCIPKSE